MTKDATWHNYKINSDHWKILNLTESYNIYQIKCLKMCARVFVRKFSSIQDIKQKYYLEKSLNSHYNLFTIAYFIIKLYMPTILHVCKQKLSNHHFRSNIYNWITKTILFLKSFNLYILYVMENYYSLLLVFIIHPKT